MKRINMRLWLNDSQRRILEMVFYMILLAVGCALGTMCFRSGKTQELCSFCTAYAVPHIYDNIMLSSLRWCFCMLAVSFFLGFCGIGQPFLCLILMFHGFGTGCALTELSSGSADGNSFTYILSALFAAAVSLTLLLSVRESVRLAFTYGKACLSDTEPFEMRRRLRMCALRYLILGVLITAESGLFSLAYNFI